MINTLPKPQIILDYSDFYGCPPPKDRISIIEHISMPSIIAEIAALNYRIRPKYTFYEDESLERQITELKYFLPYPVLYNKYIFKLKILAAKANTHVLIFSRQTCLFAMEEILNSERMRTIEDYKMDNQHKWEAIITYLLAVNHSIVQMTNEKEDEETTLERLNPKLIPLNELSLTSDPIYTPYRGCLLIQYFLKHEKYSIDLKTYFQETYNLEPEEFIYHVLDMYQKNIIGHEDKVPFRYDIANNKQHLFDCLSTRNTIEDTHKLLNIRKSPFIKLSADVCFLSDHSNLLDKTYYQLLSDFWFDRLKGKCKTKSEEDASIINYRSAFGRFFENYIRGICLYCFENYSDSTLLMLDDLKVPNKEGQIEIADIYLRNGQRILFGEIKGGQLYDKEKYGGSIEKLYSNNREKFFKDFGVNQLAEKIAIMHEHMISLDKHYSKYEKLILYPSLIVNDKALQTPLMADVFNVRFHELIKDIQIRNIIIKDLTLIHVSDLERCQELLNNHPELIWEFLDYNQNIKKFIPPFYYTLDRKMKTNRYPKHVGAEIAKLWDKHNPKTNGNSSSTGITVH